MDLPRFRSEADERNLPYVLSTLGSHGHITVGFNQNEARILVRLTGGSQQTAKEPETAEVQALELRRALNLDVVVIHSIRSAVGSEGAQAVCFSFFVVSP